MQANPGYYQVAGSRCTIMASSTCAPTFRLVRVTGDELQGKGTTPTYSIPRLAAGEIYLSRIAINHEVGTHFVRDMPTVRRRRCSARPEACSASSSSTSI